MSNTGLINKRLRSSAKADSQRLFIALDVPEKITAHLKEVQSALPSISMSKTEDFHLTLKFLGECTPQVKEKVEKELWRVKVPRMHLQLTDLGTFGGTAPRVVIVGLAPNKNLSELVESIEKHISPFGFPREREFVPHLTLARIKERVSPHFLDAVQKIKVASLEWESQTFYLYKSDLVSSGPHYTKIASFKVEEEGQL